MGFGAAPATVVGESRRFSASVNEVLPFGTLFYFNFFLSISHPRSNAPIVQNCTSKCVSYSNHLLSPPAPPPPPVSEGTRKGKAICPQLKLTRMAMARHT